MTQTEFETRTGIHYTDGMFDDFVNPLYMAAGQMDKDAFCKEFKHHQTYLASSRIISYLVSEVEMLRSTNMNLEHEMKASEVQYRKDHDLMADFLIQQAEKWSASDLRDTAISMIGICEYLRRKIEMGFNLWEADKEALKEILKQD